ncbi:uncharacterized protein LOC142322766 [Lycorma delicatula]|uniref:uncharacterized protein LOC142322766 n=1 Tax=Lycorma delicatula TaxID=130591 RepID=UPI003F514AC5
MNKTKAVQSCKEDNSKWDIKFKSIEQCKDRGNGDLDINLRLKRVSKTRHDIEGNITFHVPVGNEIKVLVEISIWGNGGWRNNFYKITRNTACFESSLIAHFYEQIRKHSGMPKSCPIPQGRYEVRELNAKEININNIPLYLVPSELKLNIIHIRKSDNTRLSCITIVVESKVNLL